MALDDVYKCNLDHKIHRAGWLRAAVLGANDGLVSTASFMIGVIAASISSSNAQSILITIGAAGIAVGAMSMAVGEYVSVRSQNDIEESDRVLEIEHLAIDSESELLEFQHIYIVRGLISELAMQVVVVMHECDSLEVHFRDELGQHFHTKVRSTQAVIASAVSFIAGGLVSFVGVFVLILGKVALSIVVFTIIGLVFTGILSVRIVGSKLLIPTIRVILGGCLGMVIIVGIGQFFHISGI